MTRGEIGYQLRDKMVKDGVFIQYVNGRPIYDPGKFVQMVVSMLVDIEYRLQKIEEKP